MQVAAQCPHRSLVHIARLVLFMMRGDAVAITAVANWAGKPEIADVYREKAARLRRLVLDKLWDDGKGAGLRLLTNSEEFGTRDSPGLLTARLPGG